MGWVSQWVEINVPLDSFTLYNYFIVLCKIAFILIQPLAARTTINSWQMWQLEDCGTMLLGTVIWLVGTDVGEQM